ncbi:12131_t:CDS:2, partial [Gigaspora margarita]
YLTPNSLALQRKQIFERLLYRSLLYDKLKVNSSQQLDHRARFIEDDYKELQILLNMALENCSGSVVTEIWEYSEKSITSHDRDQELSIQLVQILERIRRQEVNSRIAIESDSRKVFYGHEDILHQFINEQTSAQSNNNSASDLSEQGTCQEIDSVKISNSSQHKG